MKTKDEIKNELKYGEVFAREEFERLAKLEYFIPYDGDGYYHDGEKELTDKSVWDKSIKPSEKRKYHYVVWYNK